MSGATYRDSGVDLDLYEQAMERLPAHMRTTHGPRVLPLEGGFAGLFRLNSDAKRYRDPVLVSGTDGVGTKLKVALMANRFDTIGIDLVAMCVNDCLCLGAEPLFFLDYLALGKDNPILIEQLVSGVAAGCREGNLALIGGETAIMPDLYGQHDFDLAGFCVGVAERDQLITGSNIRPGDLAFGIPSSGLHSNGYSLVRHVVFNLAKLDIHAPIPELNTTVADLLLTPTRIYSKLLASILSADHGVSGIAHITGGGLAGNSSRVLPTGCQLQIRRNSWPIPPVFTWLQKLGNIAQDEMDRVFNMGIGLVLIVRPDFASQLEARVLAAGQHMHRLGQVVLGSQDTLLLD